MMTSSARPLQATTCIFLPSPPRGTIYVPVISQFHSGETLREFAHISCGNKSPHYGCRLSNRFSSLSEVLSEAEKYNTHAIHHLERRIKEGLIPHSEEASGACRAIMRLSSDAVARVMAHQHLVALQLNYPKNFDRRFTKEIILAALLGNIKAAQTLQCIDPETYYYDNRALAYNPVHILCDLAVFYFLGNRAVEQFLYTIPNSLQHTESDDYYSILDFMFPAVPSASLTGPQPTMEATLLLDTLGKLGNRGGSVIFGENNYEGFGNLSLWERFSQEHPDFSPAHLKDTFLNWWSSEVSFRCDFTEDYLKHHPLPESYTLLLDSPFTEAEETGTDIPRVYVNIGETSPAPDFSEKERSCRYLYQLIQTATTNARKELRQKALNDLFDIHTLREMKDLDIDTFLGATWDLWKGLPSKQLRRLIYHLFLIKLKGVEGYISQNYGPRALDIARLQEAGILIDRAYGLCVSTPENVIQG